MISTSEYKWPPLQKIFHKILLLSDVKMINDDLTGQDISYHNDEIVKIFTHGKNNRVVQCISASAVTREMRRRQASSKGPP